MKGKNGLFRWVSSLKPGISSKPNQTEGVNKQNKKQGKEIFGNWGGDGPAEYGPDWKVKVPEQPRNQSVSIVLVSLVEPF